MGSNSNQNTKGTVAVYPLLCGFRELVEGKRFLAEVHAVGRVLARREEDGWWLDGVNPGGMACGGLTLNEAVAEIRESFKKVMYDLVAEAPDFEAFKNAASRFFDESDDVTLSEWNGARAAVRAGQLILTELPKVVREDADFRITITRREHFDPQQNQVAEGARVAA